MAIMIYVQHVRTGQTKPMDAGGIPQGDGRHIAHIQWGCHGLGVFVWCLWGGGHTAATNTARMEGRAVSLPCNLQGQVDPAGACSLGISVSLQHVKSSEEAETEGENPNITRATHREKGEENKTEIPPLNLNFRP